MLLHFRQGIVEAQIPVFFRVTYPSVDLIVTDTNTTVAFAAGSKDYLYTEQASVANAWGPLHLGIDQWLYWDLDNRTGYRTFGITTVEPLVASTMPSSPLMDQHWYDTTTNEMKVWTGNVWSKKIRTFACKLAQGRVPVSMSANSPSFIGTQVGNTSDTYAGHILYDATTNNAIKNANGQFVTTEDKLSTKTISLSQVKVASIIVEGEAQQNMAAHTIVVFSEFGKIVHADQFVAEQPIQFGIIESSATVGQTVNVVTSGMVTSQAFDFSALGVNALLYCSATGQLVSSPVVPNQTPVAVVVDRKTIQLGVALASSTDTIPVINLATDTVYGISRLSVPAEDAEDPIVVGNNDPRFDSYVRKAGDTMSGPLYLSGTPTQDLHAATKKYVDDSRTPSAGSVYELQFAGENRTFAASSDFRVSDDWIDGTDWNTRTPSIRVGDYDVANAFVYGGSNLTISGGGGQDYIASDIIVQGGTSSSTGAVTSKNNIRAGNAYVRGGDATADQSVLPNTSYGGFVDIRGGTGKDENGDVFIVGGRSTYYVDESQTIINAWSNGGDVNIAGGGVGVDGKVAGDVNIAGGGVTPTGTGTPGNINFSTGGQSRFTIDYTGTWMIGGSSGGQPGYVLTSQGSGSPPLWLPANTSGDSDHALSSITAAVAPNTINSGSNDQTWSWDASNLTTSCLKLVNVSSDNTQSPFYDTFSTNTAKHDYWPRIDNIPTSPGLRDVTDVDCSTNLRATGSEAWNFGDETESFGGTPVPANSLLLVPSGNGGYSEHITGYMLGGFNTVGHNSFSSTMRFVPASTSGSSGGIVGLYFAGAHPLNSAVPYCIRVDLDSNASNPVVFDNGFAGQSFPLITYSNSWPGFIDGDEYRLTAYFSVGGNENIYSMITVDIAHITTQEHISFSVDTLLHNVMSDTSAYKFGHIGLWLEVIDGKGAAIASFSLDASQQTRINDKPELLRIVSDHPGIVPLSVRTSGWGELNESLRIEGSGHARLGGGMVHASQSPSSISYYAPVFYHSPQSQPQAFTTLVDGGQYFDRDNPVEFDVTDGSLTTALTYPTLGGSTVVQGGVGIWGNQTDSGYTDVCALGGRVVLSGGRPASLVNENYDVLYTQPVGGDVLIHGGDIETHEPIGFGGSVYIRGGVGSTVGSVAISAGIPSDTPDTDTFLPPGGVIHNSALTVSPDDISIAFDDIARYRFMSDNIELNGSIASAGQVITFDGTRVVWGDAGGSSLDGYTVGGTVSDHKVTALGVGAFGSHRYYESTVVNNNVAVGNDALGSMTKGTGNIAVGSMAMQYANSSGFYWTSDNVVVGTMSGYRLYSMSDMSSAGNVMVGNYITSSNTPSVSRNNVYLGDSVAHNATFTSDNVCIGKGSGYSMTTTSYNVCVGKDSGYSLSTGSYNTLVGVGAHVSGNGSTYVTAIGPNALSLMQDGSPATSLTNATGLGNNVKVSGSNQVQLGNSSTTTYVYGTVQNRSDIRDKADVKPTAIGLDFINMIEAVDYRWDMRDDYIETTIDETTGKSVAVIREKDGSKKRNRYHHGVIAQQVKQAADAIGVDFGGFQNHAINGGCDVMTIGYDEFIAPLIRAVQELSTKLDDALAKIAKLESQ